MNRIISDRGQVSAEKLIRFENENSISLPESYKAFISMHDAPWMDENHFKFFNRHADTHSWPYKIIDGIDSRDVNFLGFNESPYEGEDIYSNQNFDFRGHDKVVAFGLSANGDYICFDFRRVSVTGKPSVIVMFHDVFDEDGKMLTCHVADTFEMFINSLYKPAR